MIKSTLTICRKQESILSFGIQFFAMLTFQISNFQSQMECRKLTCMAGLDTWTIACIVNLVDSVDKVPLAVCMFMPNDFANNEIKRP